MLYGTLENISGSVSNELKAHATVDYNNDGANSGS